MKILERKKYYIPLLIVTISLFGIAIAYAALSQNLNVTVAKVTQNALSWDVALVAGTVNATVEGTSDTGRSCGTATVTATSISVANTTLSKPEDGCVYKFQVKNNGGINAKLNSITPTKPTSTTCTTASGGNMVCGNITYKVTTDATGNTLVTTSNASITAGATNDLYLVVRYTGSNVNSTEVSQSSAKFTLVYGQE